MNGQLIIAALAVVASTATAIISIIVNSCSQQARIREQYLWEARTNAYLALQAWSHKVTDWSRQKLQVSPPGLDPEVESRVTLFSSAIVLAHFIGMQKTIQRLRLAVYNQEWEQFHNLQWQLGIGWAFDLSSKMQDELRGDPSDYTVAAGNRIRYRRQARLVIRLLILKEHFRHKDKSNKMGGPTDEAGTKSPR